VVPTTAIDLDGPATTTSVGPSATVVPPSELTRRLIAAEQGARAELDRRLGGFSDLFTAAHLAAPARVRETRANWVAGGEAIRSYRAAIARLESAYGDSVLQAQRATKWPASELRAWSTRPSLSEPGETSQIADLMLDQVTEALDLLLGTDAPYQIRNGRLQLAAASDAARYSVIHAWIANRQQQWAAMPSTTRPATISILLGALGSGMPTP
jgi:hypothetical protein